MQLPTTTLPKLRLEGVTANRPAAVPIPFSGTKREAFGELELMESAPVTVPLDCGAKLTLNVKL